MIRALRRWIRPPLSWLVGRILSGLSRSRRVDSIRRILVVRIDERVGNVLLTTPLVDALTARFPDAEIDLLVAANKETLVEGVARTIAWEKRNAFVRPLRFLAALRHLRRRRYDVAIDASHWHRFSLNSAALMAWSGAPLRIAHRRGSAAHYATETVENPAAVEPEIRTKLRLMAPLGAEAPVGRMRTGLGQGSAAARMDAWLKDAALGPPLVGLAPGGRKSDHRVDPEVFAALGRFVTAQGLSCVVLWGPGEEALARRVAEASGAPLAPPTSLDELAALMRRCAAVVTNDTGPMHLSVACEAPTIALFRGSEAGRWGHQEAPHQVIVADGRASPEVIEEAQRALQACLTRPQEHDSVRHAP